MATIYQFRYTCSTENKSIFHWNETPPIVCKNDGSSISNMVSVDQRSTNEFKVIEESVRTGGHFKVNSYLICATGATGAMSYNEFTYKNDRSILSMQVIPGVGCEGDSVEVIVAPDTPIGILSATGTSGATSFDVNSTVIDNLERGYFVKITNGVDTDDCGEVLGVDSISGTIDMDIPTTQIFAPGSYILQSVYMGDQFNLPPPGRYPIGEGKIGGSYLPANKPIGVKYYKTDGDDKKMWVIVESLY